MKKIIGYIAGLIVVATVFCLIGYQVGYQAANSKKEDIMCFYATIKDIREDVFTVSGLEVNGDNYRGDYKFFVDEGTELEHNGVSLDITDFSIGNTVCVTHVGRILESDPARIKVMRLRLLTE